MRTTKSLSKEQLLSILKDTEIAQVSQTTDELLSYIILSWDNLSPEVKDNITAELLDPSITDTELITD